MNDPYKWNPRQAMQEFALGMSVLGPNAHAKILNVERHELGQDLDELKEQDPNGYALLSEHFDLDEFRSLPTDESEPSDG